MRAGIILLGLRLSLIEAVKLGALGIPLIVICISVGLFATLYLTKLTRNLFIILIIPFVSYLFFKNSREEAGDGRQTLPKWYTFIPLFVIDFLLLSFLRTISDMTLESGGHAFGLITCESWKKLYIYEYIWY